MLESKVLNFNPPIISLWNERRGRMCVESHVASGHLGSICYNSFRWKAARLFNNIRSFRQSGSHSHFSLLFSFVFKFQNI